MEKLIVLKSCKAAKTAAASGAEVRLLRCPSCGAEAKVEYHVDGDATEDIHWRVRCKYCSFQCGGFQVRSNAIKRWNTRYKEVSSGT